MLTLRELLRRAGDQSGATAVEYGIMVALIAAVIITAVILVGTETRSGFECVQNQMDDPEAAAAEC